MNDGTAEVILLDCDFLRSGAWFRALHARMDPVRRHKIDACPDGAQRRLSLGVGALARYLLARNGIPPSALSFAPDGRPVVGIPGAYLSLSHAGRYAMAGFSPRPIGVDVEEHNPEHLLIAGHFFTEAERQLLDRAEQPLDFFFRLWSRKECVVKRDGLADLRELSVLSGEVSGTFWEFPLPGYSCCAYTSCRVYPWFDRLAPGELLAALEGSVPR